MKILFYSLFALSSLTISAQEKMFSFENKVSYDLNFPKDYDEYLTEIDYKLNLYTGKEAVLGNSEGDNSFASFSTSAFFAKDGKFYDIKVNSLENVLKIKKPTYYEGYDEILKPYNTNFFGIVEKITDSKTKDSYNGYTCNNYVLDIKSEYESRSATLCIDTTNKVNNAKFMLPNQNLNGLIVKFTDENNTGFLINSITNSNLKVYFDEKNESEKYEIDLAKSKAEYDKTFESLKYNDEETVPYLTDNTYDDPIINYSRYATSESDNVNNIYNLIATLPYSIFQQDTDFDGVKDYNRTDALKISEQTTNQIIKTFRKNKIVNNKEAKELNELFNRLFLDAKDFKLISTPYNEDNFTAENDFEFDEQLENLENIYVSSYKDAKIDKIDLGIDNPSASVFINQAPEYCKDLKSKIPNFSDKDLKNLLHNYAGQTCDLYIYDSGFVGLKETIDALRKSVLVLSEKQNLIKKEDKEKIKDFLNSLD